MIEAAGRDVDLIGMVVGLKRQRVPQWGQKLRLPLPLDRKADGSPSTNRNSDGLTLNKDNGLFRNISSSRISGSSLLADLVETC